MFSFDWVQTDADIIVKNEKIAMIYSKKYNYYKFPGGGALAGDNIKLLKK